MLFNPPGRGYGLRKLMLDPVRSAVELRLGGVVAALPALGGTMRRPSADSWVNAELTIVLDAAGVETGDPLRNEQLRSVDALDAGNHPHMRFTGSIARRSASVMLEMRGLLNFRGRYVPLVLAASCLGARDDAHRFLARGTIAPPQRRGPHPTTDRHGTYSRSNIEVVVHAEWLETSDPIPAA